jgi:hypothetical protein
MKGGDMINMPKETDTQEWKDRVQADAHKKTWGSLKGIGQVPGGQVAYEIPVVAPADPKPEEKKSTSVN